VNKAKWIILVFLLLLAIDALILWQSVDRPYVRPTKQTPEETEQVIRALKRHGRITPITTPTRIYFVRGKREITILWRRYERKEV
jgi:hypothetical protein